MTSDAVRLRFIEVLARRTAAQQGDARGLLEDRLAVLLAEFAEAEDSSAEPGAGPTPPWPSTATRGPLGRLVDRVAARSPEAQSDAAAAARDTPRRAAAIETRTLDYFRDTWSRLNTRRRLTQSLAQLPRNAGPLHSHQLVHRALSLMETVSPDYLHRFIAYADALLALERLEADRAAKKAARTPRT